MLQLIRTKDEYYEVIYPSSHELNEEEINTIKFRHWPIELTTLKSPQGQLIFCRKVNIVEFEEIENSSI